MAIHYYFTVFPMEAMIASELEPEKFASYMALGQKKGSAEQLIFMEVTKEFGDYFDWEYARKKCVSHHDGRQKNSVYLGVYRVLEHIPVDALGDLYLTTRDGRSLKLSQEEYAHPKEWKGFALYKELCPVNPLVVSVNNPEKFAEYMTSPLSKVNVPAMVFADMKVVDPEDYENSGNLGDVYDKHLDHLKMCIESLQDGKGKITKIVDRSYAGKFAYQVINTGIYVAARGGIVLYPMPTLDELKKIDYDWGRSANIF